MADSLGLDAAGDNVPHINSALDDEEDDSLSRRRTTLSKQPPANNFLHKSANQITCVEFSPDGAFLAVGNKIGQLTLLRRQGSLDSADGSLQHRYCPCITFQSHQAEFDYLKSLEIEARIAQIEWITSRSQARLLLSANDNDAKETYSDVIKVTLSRVWSKGHTYQINSISSNSDQELFLAADDLRINIWHLDVTDECFNIMDIKPRKMEELLEVITTASFHPVHCNIFAYGTSRGSLRLCDMRDSALCDRPSQVFEDESPSPKSFFSEIASSISDAKFSHDGRLILTRDYLSMKVWDLRMSSEPAHNYILYDFPDSKLFDLYEEDIMLDKFECCWSENDRYVGCGLYTDLFRVFDHNSMEKPSRIYQAKNSVAKSTPNILSKSGKRREEDQTCLEPHTVDFKRKVLHCSWNADDVVAMATGRELYLLSEPFCQQL
ncbi:serine/threonine-protein phosphatase 2A regulatory subunit sur-6 [Ditylenchus destructor]|nr:serine/threonine-protein phosphatase 2A regulatory subunit sur-6 [Ditylenchus destructor]